MRQDARSPIAADFARRKGSTRRLSGVRVARLWLSVDPSPHGPDRFEPWDTLELEGRTDE